MSEQTGGQDGEPDSAAGSGPGSEVPRDDEPGGESTPLDTSGDGPVELEDRVSGDEKGSPGSNQAQAEPLPSTPDHRDPGAPLTPPALDDMNVGADDPQRPSFGSLAPASGPVSGPGDLGRGGAAPYETRPEVDGTAPTGTDRGPEVPAPTTPGESHRAPGLQGSASPAERLDTDLDESARAMTRDTGRPAGSGDPQSVPSVGTTASDGTSEEHGVVQGARIPSDEDA